MCKGVKTAAGIPPSHTHKWSAAWRRASDACDGQTHDEKNDMREDSILFRFWFVHMSLVRVAFICHSNRTRVRLEAGRDPSFQRSRSACLVRISAFTMNRTNRAIAPGFVLIEPNMTSVNTPLLTPRSQVEYVYNGWRNFLELQTRWSCSLPL